MTSLFPLRPLQQHALDGLRSSIAAGWRRVVVQAPTGFGKTILGAHMVAGALARGHRVAFVVPQVNLVDQTVERFVANGISPGDMGVMQADHPMRRAHAPLQICSVQTIDRRGFPDAKFVVVDECHIRFTAIDRWIGTRPDLLFIGLSATPWSKGMGEVWQELLIPTTLRDLIDAGWLCKFRVFVAGKPDLSGVKTVAGEYHEGQLSQVMSQKQITADVVHNWLDKGEGRRTLMFAVDRAHAATLHEQFNEAGVPCAYIDGETPRDERRVILADYHAGRYKIISSVGTMTTGVDVPCQCIIDAAPTKSEIRHVQKIGRGLRNEDGKADCIIFDHAGNSIRLGLPTEIGRTTLRTAKTDAAEKREREDGKAQTEPLPRECHCCGWLVPAKARVCESCGAERKRQSTVETVEGELVEMGAAPSEKPTKESALDRVRKEGKQAVYSQLLTLQGDKADGWVAHKYKGIFGTWPRHLIKTPAVPSAALSSWLHSERIKWAKSRDKVRAEQTADGKGLADAA